MDGAGLLDTPDHLVDGIDGFHDAMLSLERDLVNASGNSYHRGARMDFNAVLEE